MSQLLWCSQASDLRAGDIWQSSSDEVTVTAVEQQESDQWYPNGRVHVEGQITKGYGRSKKIRVWTFHPDQCLDIRRP